MHSYDIHTKSPALIAVARQTDPSAFVRRRYVLVRRTPYPACDDLRILHASSEKRSGVYRVFGGLSPCLLATVRGPLRVGAPYQ